MIELFLGQFWPVIASVGALILGAFGVAFKMRGNAIKGLEEDKAIEKRNNEVLKQEIKKVIQQEELQRDFNEATEVVIKSSDADVASKLSGFNRD